MSLEPTLETRSARVDWTGLLNDVREALECLRLCWESTERDLPPEVHAKMVHDLYVPSIKCLGAFCVSVQVTEDDPDAPSTKM